MHSNAPIDYAALVTDNMKAIGDADILVACLDGADAETPARPWRWDMPEPSEKGFWATVPTFASRKLRA